MKPKLRLLLVSLCVLAVPAAGGVLGYYPYSFYPGDNLFQNNLSTELNSINTVLTPRFFPAGTTVSLWDLTADAFTTTSTNLGGSSWSVDLQLAPGAGARLTMPLTATAFIYTFVGEVLDHDGSPIPMGGPTTPPPFIGPSGLYLLGDKCIVGSTGDDIFLNILGRASNVGEQITRLNPVTQTYITSTSLGGGLWDLTPQITVGEAAFFIVIQVPEPSAVALGLLGLALVPTFRLRLQAAS